MYTIAASVINACRQILAGPHAVTSVDEGGGVIRSLTYDANGNMLTGWNFTNAEARTTTWTSYNKPKEISQSPSGKKTSFSYGASRERFKQVIDDGLANLTTRIYIGASYEKETKPGGLTIHHHYIRAGSTTVSIVKSKSAGAKEVRYTHRDHLGSITYVTDATGAVVEELAYDPHGKRRVALDWTDALSQISASETVRGFTGHENLDSVSLIHMNGRVYDPDLGRFLSADPNVQSTQNTQALNRYTYVLNNPLSFTDPSGFFFKKLFKKIFKAIKKVFSKVFKNRIIRTAAAIAASVFIPNPFIAGFVAGMISSGGDIKAGIIGGLTATAFYGIGEYFESLTPLTELNPERILSTTQKIAKLVSHGAVGGISAEASGGDFLSAFLSSGAVQGFGQIGGFKALGITDQPQGFGDMARNAVASAAIGGTASVIGGGRFANGAMTGAFSRLFNDLIEHNNVVEEPDAYRGDSKYVRTPNNKQRQWRRNWRYDMESPLDKESAEILNWKEMPPIESIFHTMGSRGEGNSKFISPDGHSEAVFNRSGSLVTDIVDQGTYNIVPPNNAFGHFISDVLPYWRWGNGPNDPTTNLDRFNGCQFVCSLD